MAINIKIKEELEEYLQNRTGQNKNRATVTTAYQLDEGEIRSFQQTFPFLKDYRIVNKVDENIIGGFVIKFNTKVIDLSLAGQLKNFKKIMYETD